MKKSIYIIGVFVIALITSCTEYETSSITGWDYNNPKNGGFQKVPYAEQETGPGLILVEGGTFTMGRIEQDVTFENHLPGACNKKKRERTAGRWQGCRC